MAKKADQTKTENRSGTEQDSSGMANHTPSQKGPKTDVFKMWTESYSLVSKMWEDSYANLYDPWIQSAGKLFDKATEVSRQSTPEKYREFYDELVKTQQDAMSKLSPMAMRLTDRATLEKFMSAAEESNKLLRTWSSELSENAKRTQEILTSGATPGEYQEFFNMWRGSYERMYDDFINMITSDKMAEMVEGYSGMPPLYIRNLGELAKLWRETYQNIYGPLIDSGTKLSAKLSELSRGQAAPETYREFYEEWMNAYREAYERMFSMDFGSPSKSMMDNLLQSTNSSMNMYKSWSEALGKMSDKMRDVMSRSMDPEVYREFYDLWIKTYEKALEDFFEYMPGMEPMRKMMEPIKQAAKMQLEAYSNATRMWMNWAKAPMETEGKKKEEAQATG